MDTKALRQKILDLAIRGKLVPQDPNDEPASVLLEKIRAEKQQMVKDGRLKAKDIKNDTIIFKGEDNLHYYCVGGERKMVVTDKTADEDFFLLTLVAVAKELKTRGLHHNAVVILGAGVPFKRFGEEAGKLTAYLSRTGIHDFIFEEEEYSIAIEKVYCFPQCFAAVADRIANMEGRYVVADIGSWTKDIISIVDKRIDTEKSVTVPNSIITLFGEINDGVMQIGCGRILEEVLQDFIIGKEVVMPEKAQAVVISKLKEFAMEIEGLLGESGFDLDYCNVLYIGGGATIMKRFGEHKENVAYLEDIRLNAKGYELLASHQMKRG